MSAWQARLRACVGTFVIDVSLAGDDGVLALIGPNGSGKTTVLRLLAGAVAADDAKMRVGNHVLADTTNGVHAAMEHRRIGYVPQGYGLFPHLDVIDNVAFGLSTGPARLPRAKRHAKALAILDDLGCGALANRRIDGLSGGERQRVALARALVREPELLLMDEPLAALDATTRRTVREFLGERLARFGRPSVIVTHDVRDVAALANRVCVIEKGRVVQTGGLVELRTRPATAFVREFVGVEG